MRAGTAAIAQGVLLGGRWHGRADVLLRVERPSDLGAGSYEVADTKLAAETRGGTVLQISLYADLVSQIQGVRSAEAVTGPYDAIVHSEAEDVDSLGKLVVARIQAIEGITRTLTCPVVKL